MLIPEKPVVAIIGATGLVGSELLSIAEERRLPHSELRLFASSDSAGELYSFLGEELEVEELTDDAFQDVDVALFATNRELTERLVPLAVERGAIVIDSSSAFALHEGVPLIIPEVNAKAIPERPTIIASPTSATAQLAPVLKAIQDQVPLKRVIVSTYQSVSGAGKAALDELWEQTRAIYTQTPLSSEEFQAQIAFNCIPQIDVMLESGFTREEQRMIKETQKILGLPDLPITATAVRVPVFHCHAESINVELEGSLTREELVAALENMAGIEVMPTVDEFPLQVDCTTKDPIFVGRIRKDPSVEHGFHLWVVADNLRKGAALNAVQIVELLLQ